MELQYDIIASANIAPMEPSQMVTEETAVKDDPLGDDLGELVSEDEDGSVVGKKLPLICLV